MSKGSHRRNEDIKKVWDNWDLIFKKEKKEEPQDTKQEESQQEAQKENAK